MTTTPEPLTDDELAAVRLWASGNGPYPIAICQGVDEVDRLLATIDHRVAQERERCAGIVERYGDGGQSPIAIIAQAIRSTP